MSHLASLVLGDLVLSVLVALLGLAVSPAGLGNVDLYAEMYKLPSLGRIAICCVAKVPVR